MIHAPARFSRVLSLALLTSMTLAACGGDSGEDTTASPQAAPSSPAPAPAPEPSPTPAPSNSAPELAGTPETAITTGAQYRFTPSASDAENDPLEFSVEGKPDWLTFDALTGELYGTPAETDVGDTSDITVTVSDGNSEASIGPFKIAVGALPITAPEPATEKAPPPNVAPTISGAPPASVVAGQLYDFTPTAVDKNGDKLTFIIGNKPGWASFNTATGQLSGTPSASNVRAYSKISITASDGKLTASLPAFAINVTAAPSTTNKTPAIGGAPGTSVGVDQSYSFTPTASDGDGDKLAFNINYTPAWATFDTATGRLSGTPTRAEGGNWTNIRIGVTDGKANAQLPAFSVKVSLTNNTPTIGGSPATSIATGGAYSFKPTASDPNGDALTFTIQKKPGWATFNSSTGLLSGTAQAGTYTGIVISVSDGQASAQLPVFSIQVGSAPAPSPAPAPAPSPAPSPSPAPPPAPAPAPAPTANKTPTLSGAPRTSIVAGSSYSFVPTAADADGDRLTFSIQNKPSWASFNTGTGALTGTPGAGAVGNYSGIVISVSDGKASVALPSFAIAVQQAANGSATLSWTPPTQNMDGSALTNLAGYRVYYGTSSSSLTNSVQLANAGLSRYTVENLSGGTWYFAIKAYTSSGVESAFSNVGSKTIQ